jgi:hypothetical protein
VHSQVKFKTSSYAASRLYFLSVVVLRQPHTQSSAPLEFHLAQDKSHANTSYPFKGQRLDNFRLGKREVFKELKGDKQSYTGVCDSDGVGNEVSR